MALLSFLLFAGESYYPRGGMDDFVQRIEASNVTHAREVALVALQTPIPTKYEDEDPRFRPVSWYQIVADFTLTVVERGCGYAADSFAGPGLRHDTSFEPVAKLEPWPPARR